MKTVRVRSGLLHIETPLGVVNITVGLHDLKGREVDSIAVHPSQDEGNKIVRSGYFNTRLIRLKSKKR